MIQRISAVVGNRDRRTEGRTGSEGSSSTSDADRRRLGPTGGEPTRSSLARTRVEETPVEVDQIFGLLQNRRRRDVLRYLATTDGRVTLSDLAEQIAAWECEKDVSQITSKERKRVYVALYQCHLPKMDDCGAISYVRQRGTIEPGEHVDLFTHYLPVEEHAVERRENGSNRILSRIFDAFRTSRSDSRSTN